MANDTQLAATVVIPARNSATVLPVQLAALAAQDFDGPWEVLVADNGSTDATASTVESAAATFPVPLRVLDASRRRGANAARNDGIRTSRGAMVLFCDSDDRAEPGWVRSMVGALESAETAGGPLEFAAINAPDSLALAFDVPSSIQMYRGFPYALTANLGVRRDVFERIGLFDERYAHGFDEVDFGYRAHLAGLALHDAREAVVHYRLRSNRKALVRQQYLYGVGSRIFHDAHPELRERSDALGARVLTVAKQGAKLVVSAAGPRARFDRQLTRFTYEVGALGISRLRREARR